MGPHYLDRLFAPRSVALFGASENESVPGGELLRNLIAGGFTGPIYPIDGGGRALRGRRCYSSLDAVDDTPDLALIATPTASEPQILRDCGARGVRAALMYAPATPDTGRIALRADAEQAGVRMLGPGSLGIIRPAAKFNAVLGRASARPGSLALVSQSGALCSAILDWAQPRAIGFSAVVSLGEACDIDFGDVLDYLALDPHTRGILLYIEGIRDARRFLSGLRSAARMKPVVILKAGRHASGARAAHSHSGASFGDDHVFDAAIARAGAVRAMTIDQLFAAAQLLAGEHRVRGNRLAVVTNAGGLGVLAADRAADFDVDIAPLGSDTQARLDALPTPHGSHVNPVDILERADPARLGVALRACLDDPDVDGVLTVLAPQTAQDPSGAARALADNARGDKPVLVCWMGEAPPLMRAVLGERHLPIFPNPEMAVEAFAHLSNYRRNQELLRQVPGPLTPLSESDPVLARGVIDNVLAQQRAVLSGSETRAVLEAFGFRLMESQDAGTASAAVEAADTLGYPVVLKLRSPDIAHKSDVNGVRLNLGDAQSVASVYRELVESVQRLRPQAFIHGVTVERMYRRRDGRELRVNVTRDPVFGPVLRFGLGGTAADVIGDETVALPPLNGFIVRDLLRRSRAGKMLGPYFDLPPVNATALEQALLAVSEMVCELPQIDEFDINPLVVDAEGVTALDTRIRVTAPPPEQRRYAHTAIHPYPQQLSAAIRITDGRTVLLRPIRPEDAELEAAFVRDLSPQSRYFRFMQSLRELTPDMLVRFTQIDYDRELALIGLAREADGREVQVAVCRYGMNPDGASCEFAIVVADAWQHQGIGARLMQMLMQAAKARGFAIMEGEVLASNTVMLAFVQRLGFSVHSPADAEGVWHVTRTL